MSTGAEHQDAPAARIAALRPRLVIAAAALVALAVIALSAALAPQAAIRLMLASQLQAAGVEHGGLETLRVRLLPGRIVAGPVTLGRPGEPPMRVERIEATVSLRALLGRRIVVREITVVGARATAAFDPDRGKVALNGIVFEPLAVAAAASRARLDGSPGVFRFEIDSMRFRDAVVALQTGTDEPVDIAIEELALRGPIVTTRSAPLSTLLDYLL